MKFVIPATGEVWQAGSAHYLAWEGAAESAVEFSLDSGCTWQPVPADGTDRRPPADPRMAPSTLSRLRWTAPDMPGVTCRFRITPPGGHVIDVATVDVRLAPSGRRPYRWQEVTLNAPFAGRDGAGALVFKDRMWLLGGWNPEDQVHFPNDCNSEVWSSTNGTDWQLVTPAAPWEKRHTAGYVVHRGKMWIVGGDCIQDHYQNDVWNTEDGRHWNRVAENLPWGNRVLHHTVVHAGRIWVIGGQKVTPKAKSHLPRWVLPPEEVYYNDVWSSADGFRWKCETEHAAWQPRGQIGGTAVKDGYIWLLSGGTYYTRYYPEVWRSADGANWELVLGLTPWPARYYHDVAVYDDRLWVFEGIAHGAGNSADTWYSTDGLNWYDVPTPWAPRHAASVYVHAGAVWMVAGNNMFPDVWKLTAR